MKSSIISIIVEQHAEEAAFLWLLRDAAVRAPHYSLKDPAHLDDRVEAHIDGLRIAGEAGWEICKEALGLEEPGEVFAAAVLALENRKPTRIEEVFVVAETVPETVRGLTSAFGWVSPPQLTVKDLLVSTSPFRRRIGIAACAVHRVDPKTALQAAIIDYDPLLQARALRAVGELGRKDLLPVLRQQLRVKDDAYRFWAAWSAVLLGDRGRESIEEIYPASLRQASLEAFEGHYDDSELAAKIDEHKIDEHKIKEEALQKVLLESARD